MSFRRFYGTILNKYKSLVDAKAIINDPHQMKLMTELDLLHDNLLPPKFSIFRKKQSAASGIYIHGDVGCGKTFALDLFYNSCVLPKKRIHFNAFMLEVHYSKIYLMW